MTLDAEACRRSSHPAARPDKPAAPNGAYVAHRAQISAKHEGVACHRPAPVITHERKCRSFQTAAGLVGLRSPERTLWRLPV
jgi:hypothetical protein